MERKGPADRDPPPHAKPVIADGSVVGADKKAAAFDDTVAPPAREATNLETAAAAVRTGFDETIGDAAIAAPPKSTAYEATLAQSSTVRAGFDETVAGGPASAVSKRPVTGLDATLAGVEGRDQMGRTVAEDVSGNDQTMVGGASQPAVVGSSRASAMIRSGTSRLGRAHDDELPIVDDANYERHEEFARGGLGRIVKAKDRRTGRVVALKEMLGNAAETAERFAREARVTAILEHPAIVPVYELGRWPSGEPFFAMKLVAGKSLQQVTLECKTMAERLSRLSVIVAVAEALAYAHGQRVIHRDLKPANVLVGSFGETVVIDWGLAKLVDEAEPSIVNAGTSAPRTSEAVIEAGSIGEQTMDGSVLGTPSYMPPEQALGNKADQRADVYAIGAMLYQLITGVTPFSDRKPGNIAALMMMVERDRPTPVALLAPEAPPDLVTIIEKAMARDKTDRYPTAIELAGDLRRFTNGQLVQAHQYDWKALAKRWLKRHRATVTVAAALVAVLIVGAIYSVRSIIHERDTADERRVDAERARLLADEQTRMARASLATALYQKGRSAEQQQRWADAAMYYAAARVQSDSDDTRWAAGLAEARAIVPHARHTGHTEPVTASAMSRDGERVVTVDTAGEVRLWKRTDGSLIASNKLEDSLWSVAYSPDGREIAVGGDSGIVRRLSTGLDPVGTLEGHAKRIWSLAYSPDGKLIASGGEDTLARIWTIATGTSRSLKGHTQRVYSVSFSPDGKRLASGSDDRTLWLWDTEKGTGALRGAQQNGGIRAVEFTGAGDGVAAGGWDFDLKVWPVDGTQPAVWNDRMSVHDIAVSPDGRVLVSVGDTGELRFWEISTHNLITVLDLPGGRTNSVTMSADGRWLVTAGSDRVPVVWNIGALQRLIDAVGHRASISQVALNSENTRMVSVGDDSTVRVWNLADGREQLLIALPSEAGKRHYCSSPQLSKEGVIALACDDKFIRRWDLTGRELSRIPTQVYMRILSLSPDDKVLAAGHMKGIGGLFEIATGKVIVEKKLHDHQIYGVSHAGSAIATGSLDNTAKVWTSDLLPMRTFRIDGEDGVLQVKLGPEGKILAVGAQDGTLYAWDVASSKLLAKIKAHVGPIWGLAFAGGKLFTSGEDGNTFVWDLATSSKVGFLDAKEGGGGPLAVTSDGKTAVTGYRNGALVVWDVATREVRYRIGGKARDFGRCDNFVQQRRVDNTHKQIVQTACTSEAAAYLTRIQGMTHRRIEDNVDVVPFWNENVVR